MDIIEPKQIEPERIKAFLPKLDDIINAHPEFKYPPFFKAKLLLKMGDKENVLSAYLPFAKSKKNDFWVWDLLAEVFEQDDTRKLACLCKALSLKSSPDFLIKTRQKLAGLLIEKELYNEAKTEIEQILTIRSDHEWRVPQQLINWTEQPWYKEAESLPNNKNFYQQHTKEADLILFADVPEEVVVVEFVNHDKKILNFIKDKYKKGFFKYGAGLKPTIGDLLKVRFMGDPQGEFYKIHTAEKADPNTTSPAVKTFKSTIRIISPKNFGFVEDVFVDPKTIAAHNITEGIEVEGRAILSFEKKKQEWGWKAIEIDAGV